MALAAELMLRTRHSHERWWWWWWWWIMQPVPVRPLNTMVIVSACVLSSVKYKRRRVFHQHSSVSSCQSLYSDDDAQFSDVLTLLVNNRLAHKYVPACVHCYITDVYRQTDRCLWSILEMAVSEWAAIYSSTPAEEDMTSIIAHSTQSSQCTVPSQLYMSQY